MHEGNPDDFQWDVITGISGGAINTCATSVWAKEDGLAMSEWLSDEWNNLRTDSIWKWWPGGPVAGFNEKSFMDDTPLIEFLSTTFAEFPEGVKREAMVGTVDANKGEYQRWYLNEIAKDKFGDLGPRACTSSASLPGLFIPQVFEGGVYIDGGTAMGLDAISAVERCLTHVDSEEQVTLDIMLLDRFVAPPPEQDDSDTIANYLRYHEIHSYFKGLENVITTMLTYPNVNYRYILEPSGHYPKLWNLLNFGPKNTWPMQQNGMEDAKSALAAGEGAGFDKFRAWIENKEQPTASLRDFPNFTQ
uniref:PNPLA domain-containing protein n=1 Tax=Favella ehrenbergii TaxID=182087 RepID=A0A7S3MN87_9SPIT|mmetsp:Transcript_30621/g.37816  ORF Transcript_30621/g.37816 Transcript_30621/m.37816 type:complete len:304 (+) Transcript_30621:161-1072(+)